MSKRVLFTSTSMSRFTDGTKTGLRLEEARTPYNILTEEGINVDVISVKDEKVSPDPNSVSNESLNQYARFVSHLNDTPNIENVNADEYDAVYLPGECGTVYDFANNKKLADILLQFRNSNKIVPSVCHGPNAFVGVEDANNHYLVDGVKITSFTDDEERTMGFENKVPSLTQPKLEEQGANFVVKDDFTSHVKKDGQFITGRNPQSSEDISRALANGLK